MTWWPSIRKKKRHPLFGPARLMKEENKVLKMYLLSSRLDYSDPRFET
jgi:hypothetical protein